MDQEDQTPVTSASFAPWREALRQLEHPEFIWEPQTSRAPPERGSILWIRCAAVNGTESEVTTRLSLVCEAFSLLSLLARHDIGLWKSTMRELWSDFVLCEWYELEETPSGIPSLGLSCRDVIEDEGFIFPRVSVAKSASRHYYSLRKHLESSSDDDKYDLRVPLRIDLDCFRLGPSTVTRFLEEVIQLSDLQPPKRQSTKKTRLSHLPSFQLIEFGFESTECVAIDSRGLWCLHALAERGVFLSHFPSLRSPESGMGRSTGRPIAAWLNAPEVVGTLRSLLMPNSGQQPRVGTVVVADHFLPHLVPGILSAIQVSESVECVEINVGDDWENFERDEWVRRPAQGPDRQQAWEQIAFALFSQDARHGIENLELKVAKLQIREVEAVRRVVDAKNPLAVVNGRADVIVDDHPTTLRTSRWCLEDPDRPNAPVPLGMNRAFSADRKVYFNTPEPIDVRVIEAPNNDDPNKCWTVWLPGHGKAWVHPKDVESTSRREDKPLGQHEGRPSFPRIDVVEMSPESADAVIDLLEIIGHGTKRIRCGFTIHSPLLDGWCRHLFSVCPKLECIDLGNAGLGSLAMFVDSAAAGRSRLREIHNVTVSTKDPDSIVPFLQALGDPTHALTKSLRFLNIRLRVHGLATGVEVIEAIGAMIHLNRQLRKVHFGFYTRHQRDSEEIQTQYTRRVAMRDTTKVVVRRAPLETCKKLAFLSVVNKNPREKDNTDCALSRLDASLIAIVFQFAAQGCPRDVRCSFLYEQRTQEISSEDESEGNDE